MAKILIVDDTAENRDVLRGLLEASHTVYLAKNGAQAIKLAKKRLPDLILLDIMMPEMDGYEVCRILKANGETSDIPIIFVTAMGELGDEQKGFDLGAVDYVTKPIIPPILLARVRTHLDLKEKRDILVEKLKMEKELAKIKEDIERITRHDLKNPLNLIINYPKVIDKENLTEKQVSQLEMISAAGYKLLDMINLSMDLYKMEQGTYEFTPSPVDIVTVLEDIKQDNRLFIQSRKIAMAVMMNGRPIPEGEAFEVPGEKLLVYSMLANLTKNALEASPRKETIIITLSDENDFQISIHNSGAVPEDIRKTFFEKYATSGKRNGTGLGTYSARLIAETQGGSIAMESSEEQGTTITIRFPKG